MRSYLAFAAAAAALVSGMPAFAQTGPKPATPTPQAAIPAPAVVPGPAAPQLTRADVEAWLDGFLPYALQIGDVAGAVVVVVKDGAVELQKGYGFADVAARKPVDPELTLFRPGSVSKLFTWTAVMQLVEQGKLDLDADVNTYLDFKIPERFGKPITLRNIMTHTPGFEEQAKGLFASSADGIVTLEEHMKRWTPERLFPPGSTPAYSNYATALAGYIVARASGMSFDDYLDKHIFQPLGMQHATFRQPLPEALVPLMAKGYALASQPDKPWEFIGPAPAGSLSASGADMGRFMMAHLQDGALGSAQILKPETAKQMHETALTFLPPHMNRMLLGFYETNYNGRRIISHGGDTQWFHSYLHLFIDDGVGLFVSVNSAGREGAAGAIRSALFEQFADRYLPGEVVDGEVDAKTAAEHARMIAGAYDNTRRMETSFLSLVNLIGQVKVVPYEDGTITIAQTKNRSGAPVNWREIKPFLWREVGGERLLAAKVEDGKVVGFSFDELAPIMMFEPTPGWKSGGWLLPLFVVGLVALLLTALAWPISALVRRHYGAAYALTGQAAKAHRLVRIAAVAVIGLWLAWGITTASMFSNYDLLSPKMDGWLWLLQLLSPLVFFGAAGIGIWNAWVVLRSPRRWYAKVWSVVLAIGLLTILGIALTYNLIAFDVNY